MRIFIALDLPDEIKNALYEYTKLIQQKYPFEGKLTEPENLHLTLKFIGEIPDEKVSDIVKKLKTIKHPVIKARITETGVFTPSFIKILWIKLDGADKLQSEIDKALQDLFKKEARFMSHITIARIKRVENKHDFLKNVQLAGFPRNSFEIQNFKLKSSTLTPEGPIYKDVENFPLK